jgi:hypothetical protein
MTIDFRKSTFSGTGDEQGGGNCIEVGIAESGINGS